MASRRMKNWERRRAGRRPLCSVVAALALIVGCGTLQAIGQEAVPNDALVAEARVDEGLAKGAEGQPATESRPTAYAVDLPLPLTASGARSVVAKLEALASEVDPNIRRRRIVVLRVGGNSGARDAGGPVNSAGDVSAQGHGTAFEDALLVARFLSGPASRTLRMVAFLRGDVLGHAVLPVLACDEILVDPQASLGAATIDETLLDPALMAVYLSIAEGRGIFPPPVVRAFVDPTAELYRVSQVDGENQFVDAPGLAELRATGAAWSEERLAGAERTAQFTASQLRDFRWASQSVASAADLAEVLGVSAVDEIDASNGGPLMARRVDLVGAISERRLQRLQSNIIAAVDGGNVNALVVSIDSAGGSLPASLQLGLMLSNREAGLERVMGLVERDARGDAALVALACRPLFLRAEARLGGPGGGNFDPQTLTDLRPAIAELAQRSGRSEGLIVGLLDDQAEVYRYRHRRTGQVAYFLADAQEVTTEDTWERQERVSLEAGLSAAEAVELGLAEGIAESLETVVARGGLESVPDVVADRPIVSAVEWLATLPFLTSLLIMVGFTAFTMEVSAPGLSAPGFVALICFILFFWIKFLSGTAEWLEVLLFVGGVACILLEVLVIPGVGVFGIGGMVMVVSAIVLTSQTFVIPQNSYQYGEMTRGLLTVVVAMVGVLGGVIALRFLLPGTPLFNHLAIPALKDEELADLEERERMVHYDWLTGREGVALTPLRPAGKARFDDQVVAVVSDGTPLSTGDRVRVVEVKGNRVVVHPVESTGASLT